MTTFKSGQRTHWLHDRHSFFKYVTRNTAWSILRDCSLLWSSPTTFNDPFDMQFDFQTTFDEGVVRRQTLDALWQAHYSDDGLPAGNELGDLIKAVRTIFPKLSRKEFDEEFGNTIGEILRGLPLSVTQFNSEFRHSLEDAKVLCLSARNDSVLMWSHYSELHGGMVLEFACRPEHDSVWGAAMPVVYSDTVPSLVDNDFLVALGSGQSRFDVQQILKQFVTTKAKDWAYEHEWRVVLHQTDPRQLRQTIKFHPAELEAVYFGCRMSESDQIETARVIVKNFPNTKLFTAKKADGAFALQFNELRKL